MQGKVKDFLKREVVMTDIHLEVICLNIIFGLFIFGYEMHQNLRQLASKINIKNLISTLDFVLDMPLCH
jgi:hypothetical protein